MTKDIDTDKSELSVEVFADGTWKLLDDKKNDNMKDDDDDDDDVFPSVSNSISKKNTVSLIDSSPPHSVRFHLYVL